MGPAPDERHEMVVKGRLATIWRARRAIANWPMVVWLRFGARRPVVLRLLTGFRIACRPGTSDWTVVHEICLGGSYSAALRYLATRPRRGVVLDLGANIGCFSLACAQAHPDVTVIAYEPEPSNATAFAGNLARNPHLSSRISLVTQAVSGTPGTAHLNISSNLAGSNVIEGHVDGSTRQAKVRVAAFADVVRGTAGSIDLVKMDIEGSEFSIVDQTPADVWERVPAIAMEIHADEHIGISGEQLIERFRTLGYRVSGDHMGSWFFERAASRRGLPTAA